MNRVMIALDGTDFDQVLVTTAHDLFGEDADYWAVNVSNELDTEQLAAASASMPMTFGAAYPYVMPAIYTVREDGDAEREDADERAREAADASGMTDAEAVGETGAPDVAILRAAERNGAHVIVVGTHERSWFSKIIRPSVSDGLLSESSIPVLLVRSPE